MICFAFLLQSCNSTVPKPETQSSFSPCPTDQHSYKHNCFGSFTYMGSSKYIGEWKDGKQHGEGIYRKDGRDRRGIWEDGKRIKWLDDVKWNDLKDAGNPDRD